MKPIAAMAALILVLQAQSRPPLRPGTRVTSAPATVAPIGAEPIDVLNAERAWAGADVLVAIAQNGGASRDPAIRAIGRLEDPSLVPRLFGVGGGTATTANAIAQSLYGFDPSLDPDLIQRVWEWMWTAAGGDIAAASSAPATVAAVALPMARIAYANERDVKETEKLLAALAAATANVKELGGYYVTAMQALESLARVNTKLVHFEDSTVRRLVNAVRNTAVNDDSGPARRYALLALAAGRALDPDIARKALQDDDWQIRRGATQFLASAASRMDAAGRLALIQDALHDASAHVRYEAVRAYAQRAAATEGCQPLLDALADTDMTVVLEALDALADQCKDSDDVTMRVTAEVRVPPNQGPWQREAHAFVSLTKRSPEKAALATEAFVTHPVWWVRMYGAYAMAAAEDLTHLEKLAYDSDDNVREAALGGLRRLDKDKGLRAALDSLQQRGDVQLLRTAAIMLKELPPAPSLYKPLLTALQRLTRDGRMTSRDARLELLDAIDKHAKASDHTDLEVWLRDYDARVADRAALVMTHLSGKAFQADPRPAAHFAGGDFADLQLCVSIDMAVGPSIRLRMRPESAPIAVEQFLKSATKDKYYDGLTFHRVVPDFVIQGGSPGANEYSGSKDYMRDEIDAANVRGTVGLSTRGRNTGDAQFFINLVDNPRLNGNYTVFAAVENMEDVDRIQEGDAMKSMRTISCGPSRR
jgi:cyclophilin family peptidyl-prolyl cis-trans isomerase